MNFDLRHGDVTEVLRTLPDESVHMVASSPPYYGLRDYGTGKWIGGSDPECDHLMLLGSQGQDGDRSGRRHTQRVPYKGLCGRCGAVREDKQIGLEESPEAWCEKLVQVFREVRRVLRKDGTLWINCGDSYSNGGCGARDPEKWPKQSRNDHAPYHAKRSTGVKPKDLIGAPWMLAFALRADGWHLRADIIWEKKSPMPESVKDRPTKSHEYIFLFSRSARYYYDIEATKEPCSKDTHARYSRGRSANHKYSEGVDTPAEITRRAQNLQIGFAHMSTAKIPAGWHQGGRSAEGLTPGGARDRVAGVGPKTAERETAGKNNPSMQAAVGLVVGTRNRRSVWRIGAQPFKGAHFATWPEKLVLPMILAGTSERGVCSRCGAPWMRQVQKRIALLGRTSGNKQRKFRVDHGGNPDLHNSHQGFGFPYEALVTETTGWKPSCKCFANIFPVPEPVPATVVDPFTGSGTTGVVARKYGRNFIGIDLKQEYLNMARSRIESAIPLIAEQPAQPAPIVEESEESYEAISAIFADRADKAMAAVLHS